VEETTSDDARWEQILSAQGEDNLVLLPKLTNREDSSPRQASERTVRFAEALAFEDTWAGINQARLKQQQRKAA
jgi:hypothetical protein